MTDPGRADLRPRAGKAVQQFSFIDALIAGLYDGAFAMSEVLQHGDLGVGCGDALDGELVLLDGTAYLCRSGGEVVVMTADDVVPFAEVVRFEPVGSRQLVGPLGQGAVDALLESIVPSDNLFYALRIDGRYDRMTVREPVRQEHPFRGLADAVKDQHERTVTQTSGTMLGFKGPDVFQGLSVADLHLHYLDEDRAFGGHVLDFDLVEATLSVEAYAGFNLRLPEVDSYLTAHLDHIDSDSVIRRVEGDPSR